MSLHVKISHLRKHSTFLLTPKSTKPLIRTEFIPNTLQWYYQTVTKCLTALVPKRFKQNAPVPFHVLYFRSLAPHFAAEARECLTWKTAQPFFSLGREACKSCLCLKTWAELQVHYISDNRRWPACRFPGTFQSLSKEVPEEILIFKRQVNVTISQDQVCWPEQKRPLLPQREATKWIVNWRKPW